MELYDYEDKPVPQDKRKPLYSLATVTTGLAVAMSTLYTGAALAETMGLRDSLIATIVGCIILAAMASLVGSIGVKTGLSTTMSSWYSLGREGSKILSIIIAASLTGWFAYQSGFFGETIHLIFPNSLFARVSIASLWGGLMMMTTAIVGYKGLAALSWVAVPLIYLFSIIGSYLAISKYGLDYIASVLPQTSTTIGMGITMVVGSWAVGSIIQPDIARYGKSVMHNVVASCTAMIGFVIAIMAGVLMVKATGTSNIMEAFMAIGLGYPSLIFVMLLQWTSNDNNLYSSALALCNILHVHKWKMAASLGIAASIAAAFGIHRYFVNFLVILGVFIPPVGGIMVVDYFIIKKGNYSIDINNKKFAKWNIPGIFALFFSGGLTYFLTEIGINLWIPALFAVIMGGVVYLVTYKLLIVFHVSPYIY